MVRNKDDYVFFWKPEQPNGWASQWYPSPFTVTIKVNDQLSTMIFQTAEQWMMAQKALLFSDRETLDKVLAVNGTTNGDMTLVKALGRMVSPFDDHTWKRERERIVLEGSLHKFRQNEELREALLSTGDKILVEASPRDRIWGVGYGEKSALTKSDAAWGLNLLGKALMEARRILREEQERD
ncbi:DUF1768-domain-containing protein [Gloeophyllum trabeum ATCC 11539]|uniref:DUF1768-domain-containing protein n=1 Tax=Gloeophyllum trabeum (strain ATCC 11539 / FP-39264 / Madison 617) TaxID=670483 RepID=S7Q663_GLOTA|nr:DUF1768-domain-containing protein [Gloeophyllum trabeum ATCC 11539]EPQ55536.1 DUF1768-domain-containing protein [Gloeophyllum trabeum ATCC 11539]